MRGRTEAEVNAIVTTQLLPLAERGLQTSVAVNGPVAHATQQPPVQQQGYQLPADDFITGAQVTQYGQQLGQQVSQAAVQAVTPAIDMMASTNLDLVRRDFQKEFGKYGPEIYGYLGQVPKGQWTIDNLKTVVNVVQSRHLDELVRERAEQLAASGDPTFRAGAGTSPVGSSPQANPFDKLSDAQRADLSRRGITPDVVREFCTKTGMTVEKWIERHAAHAIGDAV